MITKLREIKAEILKMQVPVGLDHVSVRWIRDEVIGILNTYIMEAKE